jgi:hypothetical protein
MNNLNDVLGIIGQSLAGSDLESNWNNMTQNPDFLNVLTAVNEIIESTYALYPNTLTTEAEKQAARDSIHTAIVNNAAFQTEIGAALQPLYEPLIFTSLEQIHQGVSPHELPQAILTTVQNEIPASQHGVLTNAMNDIVTTMVNQPPTNQ